MARVTRVLAVAHRGDPYRVRENTLASFRSAMAAGADVVELDVRLTRDRAPVVLHDATLRRLWGHDRPVAELTAAEVAEVTGGGVPTLRQALAATFPVRVMVDLPDPDPETARAAVRTVEAEGCQKRVTYCGDPGALRAVRAADSGAEVALTWKRTAPVRRTLLDDVRPSWLTYRFGLIRPHTVDRAHELGLRLAAWTVDCPSTMRRLAALGVEAITSNRISTLRAQFPRSEDRAGD